MYSSLSSASLIFAVSIAISHLAKLRLPHEE